MQKSRNNNRWNSRRKANQRQSAPVRQNRPLRQPRQRRRLPWGALPWGRMLRFVFRSSVVLGGLAVIGGAAVFGVRSLLAAEYFQVRQVRVEAQQRVSEEQVVALSEVCPGTNIFALDLELIGRRIEQSPWIARAEVKRVFPNELLIRIQERQPKAIVRLDHLYYVDAEGEVFKSLSRGESLDYPVISGIERSELLKKPEAVRKRLLEALALLDKLGQRKVFGLTAISELAVDEKAGMTLFTHAGGVPVHIGQADFAPKLDRLERIYPELQQRLSGIQSIDLNVAQRVIVKLDNGGTPGKG